MPTKEHTYDSEWRDFCNFVGIIKKREVKSPSRLLGPRITYGVISDLHIPFHNKEAIVMAVEWLIRRGAKILYVGGDILDCYSLSRFNQYKSIPIQQEFQEARKILDYLSRSFVTVRLLEGNHEARVMKYLSSRLDPSMLNFIMQKGILARCSEDMPNIQIESQTVHGTKMGWLTQVGDAVIGHPEKQSKLPLRPVEWFAEWLQNWHEDIGFERPRLVIAGHTHMAGYTFVGRTMVVESGCLCLIQSYALEPRLYLKPQKLTATIFDQVNLITDHNSVRQYYPCPKNK